MVPLIDPKDITIHSDLHNVDLDFRIGFYPVVGGMEIILESVETIKALASNDSSKLSKEGIDVMLKISKYASVKDPSGNYVQLENSTLIDGHLRDYEVWAKLVLKIHDYNSFFLNSEKLSKTSQSFMKGVNGQATKILAGLKDSLSRKG